ncbi:hypothetical protein [Ruminococcus sp.]|uniref:hypothetical protein n=1 Tax=Ruminococcus sp. TaxID=41978 RepID=UPI0025DA8C40|nr:hypothetical protein [Ruminococcus sp.]MCR4638891.1 hypothetical protein [Ruminococcus sp.]
MYRIIRSAYMILIVAAAAIFVLGIMEIAMYFKGEPYYVHIDDLKYCNEQKAIEGNAGRVFCMYRVEKVSTGRKKYSKNAYKYLNYYMLDNASPDEIEKIRVDKSYRPENYCVYSYYTSDETKKQKLDELCISWENYMNGRTNTMPEIFYIDGRVSPKSFYEYDVAEFKNAARKYGFSENEITSLLIFDSPVEEIWLFLTPLSGLFLVGTIIYLLRKKRRNMGYY